MGTHTTTENGIMGDVAAHTSRTLVGRDAELTEIASSLGVRASASRYGGAAGVVLLSGDAGVGKTRLLASCATSPFTEGWQVFAGHCLDFGDSALPYLPFSEVLGRLAADLPDVVDEVAGAAPRPRPAPARPPGDGRRGPRATTSRGARPRPTSSRPSTRSSRPPPRRRRCSSSSRTPTGPTSRPATCSASSSPAPFAGPVAVVASLPLRRPAPPPPAPPPGRRVVPPPRRRPGRALAAARRRRARADRRAGPRAGWPRTSSPTSSTAPRATRSSSRS